MVIYFFLKKLLEKQIDLNTVKVIFCDADGCSIWLCHFILLIGSINPLSANFTKWSNTLKQFVGKLSTNCLSVFDHFVGLAHKGLNYSISTNPKLKELLTQGVIVALACNNVLLKIKTEQKHFEAKNLQKIRASSLIKIVLVLIKIKRFQAGL